MKSLVQDIQARFKRFMNSPYTSSLLVLCEPEDSALLLKSLEAVEQDPAVPDIFLTFGHAFENLDRYVRQMLDSIRQQLAQVNEALTQRGYSALAPFPSELADEALLPATQLYEAMRYVRSIVPRDRRIAYILYPLELDQPAQYLQLIDYVREQLEDEALAGTKLIARDSVALPILLPMLDGQPKVDIYRPELSLASMEKKLNTSDSNISE